MLPQASTRWPCWLDSPIQMTRADARLQVLLGEPGQRELLLEGVEQAADRRPCRGSGRYDGPARPRRRRSAASTSRSGSRPRTRSPRRSRHRRSRPPGVESMPPESPSSTVRNPFLAHVVVQPEHQRAVDLRLVLEPRRRRRRRGGVRLDGRRAQVDPADRESRRTRGCRSCRLPRRGRGRRRAGRSLNCGARAMTSPDSATTIESPSNTSSSWPPTMLT